MIEKILTPINKKKAITNLSKLVLGWISPNPTVVKDVKAKYSNVISYSCMSLPIRYAE